jgi:hypothetical protein
MDKRLSALTKTVLAAQLKKRGEKAYGLKDELVERLRNAYLREEKEGKRPRADLATDAVAAAAPPADAPSSNGTPKRKRGRPRKQEAAKEEAEEGSEEQQTAVAAEEKTKKRVAKRRRGEEEEEEKKKEEGLESTPGEAAEEQSVIAKTTETHLMWPSLVPKMRPQAYEPSCGWSATLPGQVRL